MAMAERVTEQRVKVSVFLRKDKTMVFFPLDMQEPQS